jgi:fibronectin type 3 domain-containing protein
MNTFSRGLFRSFSLFAILAPLAVSAAAPMGVYKGARGGGTAPSFSDYAGLRQFETWFGHQVPRSIEFIANDSWSKFGGAASWAVNLTSGWSPQRWRPTYSIPLLPDDGSSTLAQGAAGDFNSYFANVAQLLIDAGEGDAILRLGWEMNGAWYPWRVLNAADAANYRDYWIQIVTTMRGVTGANFKFDFCPIVGQQSYPPINAYPGDAYVDIVGLDVYNTSYSTSDPATRWSELVNEAYGLKYWADFGAAHGKPLSYPEWATGIRTGDASGGGDDPLFIQNMFTWIATHDVAYHNYWDYQAPDFHGQLSNGQFPNSAAKFKELFGPTFAGQVLAPDKLTATAGNSRVELAWPAVSGATSYNILRSPTLGHTFTTIGSATAAVYTDAGLTNGATFHYVVTAVKSGVESDPSPRVTATPIDATLVDDADSSGVLVTGSWTSSTSGENYYGLDYLHDGNTGATGGKSVRFTPDLPATGSYNVYARWTSGSNRASNTPVVVNSNNGPAALTLNQQVNGGGWYPLGTFDFTAGSAGNVLISNTATDGYVVADAVAFISTSSAQPPAIPGNVTATAASNQVSLAWPVVPGAAGYDVKRSTAANGAYVTVASDLLTTTLTDTGLANGVVYYYTVTAINAVGRSADSTPVGIAPVGPPAAPNALNASVGDASVTLTWSAQGAATSYNVKRATTAGGPYTTVASANTAATYIDTAVSNQVTYYYIVSASNGYGEGPNSAEIAATPQAQYIVDDADPTGVVVTGAWTVSTTAPAYYGSDYLQDGNTGAIGGKSVRLSPNLPSPASVDIYLRWTAGTNRASNVPVDINHAAGTTTVTVNQRNNDGVWILLGRFNFAAGTAGNVTIRNDGADGFVIADAARFVITSPITTPPAPTGLTAATGDSHVTLTWSATSGAGSYSVKRSTVSGGPYSVLASGITTASFTDTTAVNGTTYFYVVSASNLSGDGANSTQAFATPSADSAIAITYVSSGRSYTLGAALVGQTYAFDRTYKITQLSPALTHATMIRTGYDDKTLTTATHLKFTVGQPSILYICYDTRATALPAFLDSSWTLASETFSTTHSLASPFKVFTKTVPAGTITLGANLQPPAAGTWGATAAHYVVLIVPMPPAAATVSLSDLNQVYDGSAKSVTATTVPAGLAVALTYDGASALPTHAGSYAITASVTTPHYTGSASGTLVITKAAANVSIGALTQTYDGSPKNVTAETVPADLGVQFTYDGQSTPPTPAGQYAVIATIMDADYSGSASGSLFITKAPAAISLTGLTHTYDGTAKVASAGTTPAGLAVNYLYDGNATAPVHAGSYAVAADIADPNYTGSTTGTLTIQKANAAIALGGLHQLYDGTPRTVMATTTPAGLTVNLTYENQPNAPIYPGNYAVEAILEDHDYAATIASELQVGITALVRHAPTLNGVLAGSAQVLLPENITLNGRAIVSDHLLVPGTPDVRLNGHPLYGGAIEASGDDAPTNYLVTLNANAALGRLVRRVNAIAWPNVPPPTPPSGTRNVVLNHPTDVAGDFSTVRDLTLNGDAGTLALPPGSYRNIIVNNANTLALGIAGSTQPAVYELQSLKLNGNSHLIVAGPVVLRLASGLVLNASVGDAAQTGSLTVELSAGDVTLNNHAVLYARVVAPAGSVILNGSSQLVGTVICDRLTLNGDSMLDQAP